MVCTISHAQGLITHDVLIDHAVAFFLHPREKFTLSEFDAIRQFIEEGGSVLYLAAEGGESTVKSTNFNYLLEEYGMSVNSGTAL